MKISSKLPLRCERLKELRIKNGYTQNTIAEKVDVTTKTYKIDGKSVLLTLP